MVDETSLGFDPIRFDLELNRRGSVSSFQKGESAGGLVESQFTDFTGFYCKQKNNEHELNIVVL